METEKPKMVDWEAQVARACGNLPPASGNQKLIPRDRPAASFHPTKFRRLDAVNGKLLKLFQSLSLGKERWPLFLYGPVGTGKTSAALALSDCVQTVWFGTIEDVCDIIVAGGRRPWALGQYDFRRDRLPTKKADNLVVLDEIGTRQKVIDLHYQAVKEFADARELDHQRVAIYISNLEPDQVAAVFDDRIALRLLCGTWFKLDGKDRRMENT